MKQKTSEFKYLKMSGTIGDLPEWIIEYPDLNLQVKSIREFLGISQGQLADNVGLTWRSIPNIESGKVNPKITTLKKIAEYLNCELKILLIPKKELSGETGPGSPKKKDLSSLHKNHFPEQNDMIDNEVTDNGVVERKKEYFWD